MTHKLLFTIPQEEVTIEAAKLENWLSNVYRKYASLNS